MLLCYVTDRSSLAHDPSSRAITDDLMLCIRRAAVAGVDWIQIREKDLAARELLEVTRSAVAAAQRRVTAPRRDQPQVLVNDRLDIALAADAAGVHLGGGSIPIGEIVRWCRAGNAPPDFQVGASCHDVDDGIEAEHAGANYIFFGPVYETPSKMKFGAPQGIDKLAEVCSRVRIPVLAIGGINEGNAAACMRAGAAGIAAIRLFQQTLNDATLGGVISRLRAIS